MIMDHHGNQKDRQNDLQNDQLWELLGNARPPAVSPFFARNVLRAVRQEEDARPARSLVSRLRRWTWPAAIAGTCAVALLAAVGPGTLVRRHHSEPVETTFARQIVGNPDYEVIKHLDELVADEESSLWLDDSVH